MKDCVINFIVCEVKYAVRSIPIVKEDLDGQVCPDPCKPCVPVNIDVGTSCNKPNSLIASLALSEDSNFQQLQV